MSRATRVTTHPARPRAAWAAAPEQAALDALGAVLDIAVRALHAAHPGLGDPAWPAPQTTPGVQTWAAYLLLTHAATLRQDLARYAQVLDPPPDAAPRP